MNWELIHKLLDKLDAAANSNSFWIELGVPNEKFELNKVLVHHLKTGNFHFELVKQDITREWNNYSEIVFPKNSDQAVLIQRPGNTWNGNEEIKIEAIPKKMIAEHLTDILTGQQKYYSKSSLGTQLSFEEANSITSELLSMLSTTDKIWKGFLIKPDFLNPVDEYFESGYIKLGYFENCGRDMAMAFLVNKHLYLLLTNGYS